MAYLAEHAPGDRWGFDHLARRRRGWARPRGARESFPKTHPEWSPATASSVAQGYVARAREWGLVEPRLIEGRYWLTDIGRQLRHEPPNRRDQRRNTQMTTSSTTTVSIETMIIESAINATTYDDAVASPSSSRAP